MPTSTAKYGLLKPLVNNATDQDQWGGQLNGDMDDIDGLLFAAINSVCSSKTSSFPIVAPTIGSVNTGDAHKLFLCDCTVLDVNATLPTAADAGNGFPVAFKKTDASVNSIIIAAADNIDGVATYEITDQYAWVILVSDGTTWNVLGKNPPPLPTITGRIVQVVEAMNATYASSSATIPYDNSIPQSSEGTEFTQAAINFTPAYATSLLLIEAIAYVSNSVSNTSVAICLFKDAATDASAVGIASPSGGQDSDSAIISYKEAAVDVTARVYKLRYGGYQGTSYINGTSGGPLFGGVMKSGLRITEVLQ